MDDIDNAIDSVIGNPSTEKPSDPLDGAVDSVLSDGRQRLRQSVYGAVRSNPDQYAESKRLSGETGLPPDVVDRNFEEISNKARLSHYDNLLQSSPVLAERLQDNDFARLAHDDTEALSELEKRVKEYGELKAPSSPLADVESYLTGLKESFVQGARKVGIGIKMQAQDLLNSISPGDPIKEQVRRQNYVRQYMQAQDIQEMSEPEFETSTARAVYGGVSSFLRTTPGLAASIATRSPLPMLGIMGAETEAEAYGKYRSRGATAREALLGGVGEGATEVATEMLPMSFLVKSLGRTGAGEFLKGLLARELPTEQIATLVQDAIDTAIANPDKTWGDYVSERPDAAYQTLIATLTQSAISGGINAAALKLSKQEKQVNESAAGAEALQNINQIATDSKLRTRDPQSFAQYIENLTKDGPMQNIAIPVEQWNTYWQGVKADPRAMIAGIVGNTGQYDEAVHTGGDIIIPTARYAAQLAATEHAKALSPDIRFQADELTPREAEILNKELQKASETVNEPTTADKVKDDIVGQLVNIGQERSSAEAYATLHESFFKTLGAKAGIDAVSLYGRYGLKIDRPLPEVLQDGKVAAIDVFLDRLRAGKLPAEEDFKKEGGASLYDMKLAMDQLGKTLESRGLDIRVLDNATIRQELMKIPAPQGTELFQSGTFEEFMAAKSAERQKKISDAGLVVAVKDGSNVYSGQAGWGHIHLLMKHPEVPNSAETGYADKNGKFYTRAQAMEQFGVVDSANITELNQPATGDMEVVDLSVDDRFHHLFYGEPTKEQVSEFQKWLDNNPDTLIRLYHGSAAVNPIQEHGIKKTTASRRNSLQSASGYVYLSVYPDMAEQFAKFAAANRGPGKEGKKQAVYYVDLRVAELLPDKDQLRNQRQFGNRKVGNSLAESLVYGHAARFKGDIPASRVVLEKLFQGNLEKRGSIRFGQNRQFNINLFEKADLSTFLHESGHFFLEVFGDVASEIQTKDQTTLTASEQLILKDYEAALKWLGVESRDQIKTEHHEKWAGGFEAYLMEGKAPSSELRGAFSKFRAWLVSIYKAIRNLNVSLNDDVRGVMDRLLATEEEIDFAEREAELLPVFTDAESAGMTETEFAAYRNTIEQASNSARESLQQKLMGDIRREQEKWWKDARTKMRSAVEDEVNKQPAYIAESVLKTGKMPDGSDLPEGMPAIKLSKKAIEDAYGKDVLGRLPRGTTSAEGVDMSTAAEILGYESAEKLLADLTTLQPKNKVIDAETDVRMRKEHGDMLLDGSAAAEAEKAVISEGRGKVIAAEIKALKKKAAQVKPFVQAERKKQTEQRRQGLAVLSAPMASQEALRAMAEGIIAQKKLRDIRPNDYAIALRNASKQAVKLAAKDDYEGALMEKQRELLNLELYRAANERLESIEKGRKYLSKFDKDTKTKNLRGEFLEQIQELLTRFDLRRKSLKKIDQDRLARTPLVQWINEESDRLAAVVPDIPGFVLDETYRKHYKDMTGEEFDGLVDSVKQLEKLARRENEQYMAIRQMNFEQEREAILQRLKQFHPEAFDEHGEPIGQEPDFVPSISKAAKKIGDKFSGEFLNPETILNLLEGGQYGQVEQSIFGRLSDRSNWKATRLEGIYKTLKPLFKQYSYKEKLDFSRKDIGTPIGIPMTRENAVVVSLLYGNKEGRERLMNYGWSDFQIQAIIGLLDKKDMTLVEGIWKLFDQDLWPELKSLNERTKGKSPPKVEAVSYPTKHGQMNGGYFRLKYDTELDERAHKLDESQAVKEMLGGSLGMSAKTNQGTSQERKEGVKLRPRLDLGVFSETVNETVHDLAYREAVADTMRLLNDGNLQKAIKAAGGTPAYRALIQRVREVAAPPRNPSGFIEKTISIARKNTVVTLLSGLRTALLNLTGVVPAFSRVNTGVLLREIGKFYSPRMAEMYRFATENSEYMKHRFNNFDRDLQDMAKKMTVNGKILPDIAGFLWFMGMTDRGVTVPVWNAAFADGMKEHKNDVKMAVEYADHVVRQTQGSGREVDLSQIMSGHGGWGQLKKAFTMFYSYFNAQLGQLVRAGAISKQEAKDNRALAVAKFTGRFMLIVAIPAALSTIGGRDDDDIDEKNWFKKLAQSTFLYMAGMVPLVRDLASFAWSKLDKSTADFGFKISPIQSAGEGVVKGVSALKDIALGDGDEKDVKDLIMGTSYAVGLPGKLMSDVTLGTAAFLEGEADASAIFFGPPK